MKLTKKEVLELAKNLYSVTGIECQHVSELNSKSTTSEYNEAWIMDRGYFRGLADTIYNYT
ncbi:hypothetical protein Phi46:3_gp115 [Cellulophaga phage phi46:3]|uniref:Uncharacterized protein n=1 Tax=Cellulophaga phage phi46:3 TaxID=1327985 RepID=R9ZZU4_9CAUD|nr:hypothetical protein Phi46:3_gp115 [Cellulophaga phage phi46:3]AGO48859.1 hypothetical protein Phi46:3_gp115 [Cellulophaga phage phi46:3]